MDAEAIPEASDGGRTPSPFDRLPDEVLIMIISKVQDAAALLDCVSLVCRRWRRLQPLCWTDVDLRLPYCEGAVRNGLRAVRVRVEHARLLQHAPPQARLRLSLEREEAPEGGRKSSVRLERVLRCFTAGIAELFLEYVEPWSGGGYKAACKGMLQLIQSNGHLLKKFTFKVGDETLWYEALAERGLWPGLPGALLHCSALRSLRCPASCVSALRAMPGLATLELDFVPKDEGAEDGMPRPEEPWPAATSLPALRSLTFNHCKMDLATQSLYPWAGELLVALCRAAPGLARLEVACPDDFDACWCSAEDLRLDEALAGLSRLRSVRLDGGVGFLGELTDLQLDALVDIELAVQCSSYDSFMQEVQALRAAKPRARVKVNVHIPYPTTMHFDWPGLDL